MSLAGSIDERLWLAIQASYEAGDYSSAILDCVFYLSELIRNKSGLDTDGNSLVGDAFGGANPIIKVNSLHTESERFPIPIQSSTTEFILNEGCTDTARTSIEILKREVRSQFSLCRFSRAAGAG